MAYLAYTSCGAQIIHDEKMEEYKRKKTSPPVLAQFPLTEAEAKMTLIELTQIYPPPPKEDQT